MKQFSFYFIALHLPTRGIVKFNPVSDKNWQRQTHMIPVLLP